MGAVDIRRWAWTINRWFLLQGRLAWLQVAAGLVLSVQLLSLLASLHRLASLDEGRVVAPTVSLAEPAPPPEQPFPPFSERFALTAQALSKLTANPDKPGKIKFAYDQSQEARIIRQTATIATDASWQQLGPMLDSAQGIGRTAYISRLRLTREDASQPALKAEIQVTIAYRDAAEAGTQ